MSENKKDNINPSHYKQGRIDCIDFISDRLGYNGFKSYLLGSHFKYTYRFQYKHADLPQPLQKEKQLEDIRKSQWYLAQYQVLLRKELKEKDYVQQLHNTETTDPPSDTEKKDD